VGGSRAEVGWIEIGLTQDTPFLGQFGWILFADVPRPSAANCPEFAQNLESMGDFFLHAEPPSRKMSALFWILAPPCGFVRWFLELGQRDVEPTHQGSDFGFGRLLGRIV
jgi:hypothetical protein